MSEIFEENEHEIDNILLKGLAQKQRAVLFSEEKNGNKSV